ncbi:MAG: hypothetical protein ACLP05_14185 [Candidatus Kryptoniota bacterium]
MNWLRKLFSGKPDKVGKSEEACTGMDNEKHAELSSPVMDAEPTGGGCRCCGSTDGLYSGSDICSECDVSYYS